MLPPVSRCSPVTGPMFSVAAAPVQAGLVTMASNVASTLSAPASSSECQYPGQHDTDVDMTLKNDNDDDNIEDTGIGLETIFIHTSTFKHRHSSVSQKWFLFRIPHQQWWSSWECRGGTVCLCQCSWNCLWDIGKVALYVCQMDQESRFFLCSTKSGPGMNKRRYLPSYMDI